MRKKISILGVGNVGATIAYTLTSHGIASEIVLIDINKNKRRPINRIRAQNSRIHKRNAQQRGSPCNSAQQICDRADKLIK